MPVDERARTQAAELSQSAERQVLGSRYELLGLLGSGGMGNVYEARDVELDEVVALRAHPEASAPRESIAARGAAIVAAS